MNSIHFHPTDKDIVFAGTRGGVAKSTDGGDTWAMKRNGFRPYASYTVSATVYAMAIDTNDPNIVYAGLGKERRFGLPLYPPEILGYVYKSLDCGESWTETLVGAGAIIDEHIMSIKIDPFNSSTVYLLSNTKLFKSADAGATWAQVHTLPMPDGTYTYLCLKRDQPGTLFVSYAYDGESNGTGVLKSIDGGQNWETVLSEPAMTTSYSGISRLIPHPQSNDTFFATFSRSQLGVYRTDDAGAHWRQINAFDKRKMVGWFGISTSATDFAVDPKDPSVCCFLSMGTGAIYLSTNSGTDWENICSYRISEDPDTYVSSGAEILCHSAMIIDRLNPCRFIAGDGDQSIFKTLDGGKSFFKEPENVFWPRNGCISFLEGDPDNPNVIYGGDNENKKAVFRSTDFGVTFEKIGSSANGLSGVAVNAFGLDAQSPPENRTLYVGTSDLGMFRSVDNGTNWSAVNNGLPAENVKIMAIAVDRTDGGVIYAGARCNPSSGYVAKSTDGGDHWNVVLGIDASRSTLFGTVDIRDVKIDPFDPSIIYAVNRDRQGYGSNKIFWKSVNAGTTWTYVSGDVFNIGRLMHTPHLYYGKTIAADPALPGRLYLGFLGGGADDYNMGEGLFVSDDHGDTWQIFNDTGLSLFNIHRIVIDPVNTSRIYALTGGNGIFRYGEPPCGIPLKAPTALRMR